MTTIATGHVSAAREPRADVSPLMGLRFDWLSALLSAWLVGGAYLDGWAHHHLRSSLETFFTPWHAVLYSGFMAYAVLLVGLQVRNVWRGMRWSGALPAGYALSLLGVVVFALGGAGDLSWHTLFGIETGVEALLSPTHYLLVLGVVLMTSGAFRAAWQRADGAQGWAAHLPMILSLTLSWSVITFITQGLHPFAYPAAASSFAPRNNLERDAFQLLGLAQIVVQSALLMGVALLLIRRWDTRLPLGTFTLIFTLNSLLMSTQLYQFRLVPAMIVGGLAADVLLWWLKPSQARALQTYLFALLAPLALYAVYFVILAGSDQIWWRVHALAGAVFAAGLTGVLMCALVFQPCMSSAARSE